ncbi:EAL domain-containing protein [Kineococcus sp. T13]|uniref:sensor domain-containing phosphodiesterase n=1 Tax=Kineococcus vitellinus TaxID=2696565 RepID=UPI001412D09C|nr:EAL domain-containing protein [Kineococcus vitellinus]NAZ75482.1 EAL domain-containing protein [Kineococcus vitellinus]
MVHAPRHPREGERLASLRSYQVLDTGADAALQALTAAAAQALGVPTALVSLVDEHRQFFKAATGLEAVLGEEAHRTRQTPREESFCAHVVATEQPLVVPDAGADARFAHLPMVTGPQQVRFYAGAPIIGRDGLALGALCVKDRTPRRLEAAALQVLTDLAAAVAELLELRRLDAAAGLHAVPGLHDGSGAGSGARQVLDESHRLRAGIDAGELVVHYQPVVDLLSGRWQGVEALVRWEHPQRGLLPPAAFLPIAEASGLIVPLGRQVLTLACTQVALWREQLSAAAQLHVAVNVSGRQLSEPDVVEVVTDALLISGLPASALTIELTETSAADVGAEVDIALQRIRALGVRLALDDFGTGYASFSYLQRFQPDVVKIDRCFVAALGRSPRDDLLAQTLIDLGSRLGCAIVAEGIEEREQVAALSALGVRLGQGYFFSAPRGATEVGHRLSSPETVLGS